MTREEVKETLFSVIKTIQTRCGNAWLPLSGSDVPKDKLPKFDSTVWPAATTRLGKALGIKIPSSTHVFGGKNGAPLNTVDQIVDAVCAYAASVAKIAAE